MSTRIAGHKAGPVAHGAAKRFAELLSTKGYRLRPLYERDKG